MKQQVDKMTKVKKTASDKIAKLAQQREHLKKQIADSKRKIEDYEIKLAQELGQLALTKNLDKLTQPQLVLAFDAIAKEHNLL